jgi:hypothetical protein
MYWNHTALDDRMINERINLKRFRRKWLWPNEGTMPAFTHGGSKENDEPQWGQAGSRLKFELSTSVYKCRPLPARIMWHQATWNAGWLLNIFDIQTIKVKQSLKIKFSNTIETLHVSANDGHHQKATKFTKTCLTEHHKTPSTHTIHITYYEGTRPSLGFKARL